MDRGVTSGWPLGGYDPARRTGEVEDALRAEYERYLMRQSSAFLTLVPRGGVRPLYGEARSWAKARGVHDSQNPMPSLLAYCRAHLPLPTFEVWLQDYRACRIAHAIDAASTPLSEEDHAPKQVLTRGLDHGHRRWFAGLHLFRDGRIWRGYITFREVPSAAPSEPRSYARTREPRRELRTADIFCETDPTDIERRFNEYRADTLRGFLRSTLP
jgi:hypothetical protein